MAFLDFDLLLFLIFILLYPSHESARFAFAFQILSKENLYL